MAEPIQMRRGDTTKLVRPADVAYAVERGWTVEAAPSELESSGPVSTDVGDVKSDPPGLVESALRGLKQFGTAGFGDEISAAIEHPLDEKARAEDLAAFRARDKASNPVAFLVGGLPVMARLPIKGVGATPGARALSVAGPSGVLGGIFGAGESEGDLVERAKAGLASGISSTALGGLAQRGMEGAGRVAQAAGSSPAGRELGAFLAKHGLGELRSSLPGLTAEAIEQGTKNPAAVGMVDDFAAWLKEKAGNRAIKATNALPGEITKQAQRLSSKPGEGLKKLGAVGQEMVDSGIVKAGDTAEQVFARASSAASEASERMSAVLADADKAAPNAGPSFSTILRDAWKVARKLQASDNKERQTAGKQVEEQILTLIENRKDIGGANARLSFSDAHAIRKTLGETVYGKEGRDIPGRSFYKEGLRDVQNIVGDEIDAALNRALPDIGGSRPWKEANRAYHVATTARKFADSGMGRDLRTRAISPSDYAGLAIGTGLGAAGGLLSGVGLFPGAALGGAAGAAGHNLLRKAGSATAAVAANAAAKGVKAAGDASTAPIAPLAARLGVTVPEAEALLARLLGGRGARLTPSAAEEDPASRSTRK
jgi:hypothetical protein